MVLRQPPSRLIDTLSFSGAGRPRTPDTRTRSGPSCSRWMVEKSATTSGLAYSGPPIS